MSYIFESSHYFCLINCSCIPWENRKLPYHCCVSLTANQIAGIMVTASPSWPPEVFGAIFLVTVKQTFYNFNKICPMFRVTWAHLCYNECMNLTFHLWPWTGVDWGISGIFGPDQPSTLLVDCRSENPFSSLGGTIPTMQREVHTTSFLNHSWMSNSGHLEAQNVTLDNVFFFIFFLKFTTYIRLAFFSEI